MSASTAAIPIASATSRATATSRRCSTASPRPRRPGWRSRSTWSRSKGLNADEIAPMLAWCVEQGHDLSLIETMPLGAIDEDRADRFLPLTGVFAELSEAFDLTRDTHSSGGPARYWRVGASGTRLGLISPLTANFCDGCNRVRLTTEGRLYSCLGHDDQVDLKTALRDGGIAGARCRDRRRDRDQARAPRFPHRRRRRARGCAAHERHRRMTKRALVASPTPDAQDAERELRGRLRLGAGRRGRTDRRARRRRLHAPDAPHLVRTAQRPGAGVRDEPGHGRFPDERMAQRRARRPARTAPSRSRSRRSK